MNPRSLSFALALITAPLALHAQATRTWVSGVGDDANPGSRTAPCRTFAGAISKTAPGGIIDALDAGGFGAVTITKSITLDGTATNASILVSGTNAVVISAGATDIVVLKNLDFQGIGTGVKAIRIVSAGAVHIENCTINGFATGISFESSSPAAQLFVKGCEIRTCTAGGATLSPSGTGASAKIENTRVEGCAAGFVLTAGFATLSGCSAAGIPGPGFDTGTGTKMTLAGCVSSGNTTGAQSSGTMWLSDSTIINNIGKGLHHPAPGTIISLSNNRITGNNPDGVPTSSVPLQ